MSRFLPVWLTAHRTVLLGLAVLAATAFVVSAVDDEFAYRPDQLVLSLVLALVTVGAVTYACAAVLRVPPGSDSWAITALILFFILPGVTDRASAITMVVGAGVAAASKYVLVWRRRLIVNPAVAGAIVCYALAYAGVGAGGGASFGFPVWWVAAEPLLIPMIVIGAIVVTALREWRLVAVFGIAVCATVAAVAISDRDLGGWPDAMHMWIVSSPMLFVAAIMLPEPLTSPATRAHRAIYAAGVGVLMYSGLSITVTDSYTLEFVPEVALLIGNLYAFVVRLVTRTSHRVTLDVAGVDRIADDTYHVRLAARGAAPNFRPGQWATVHVPQWSVPLWRSTRRVFSFVNEPGSDHVEFAFTVAGEPSPYKRELIDGRARRLHIDAVGGDFVLRRRASSDAVVLLASGIGITPFLSVLRSAAGTGEDLTGVTLIHVVRDAEREVFTEDLDAARELGARIVVEAAPAGFDAAGRLGELLDADRGPTDYYVSGSPAFVRVAVRGIRATDPGTRRIHTDSFLGY